MIATSWVENAEPKSQRSSNAMPVEQLPPSDSTIQACERQDCANFASSSKALLQVNQVSRLKVRSSEHLFITCHNQILNHILNQMVSGQPQQLLISCCSTLTGDKLLPLRERIAMVFRCASFAITIVLISWWTGKKKYVWAGLGYLDPFDDHSIYDMILTYDIVWLVCNHIIIYCHIKLYEYNIIEYMIYISNIIYYSIFRICYVCFSFIWPELFTVYVAAGRRLGRRRDQQWGKSSFRPNSWLFLNGTLLDLQT